MPEPFLEQRRPRLGLQLFDEPIFLCNRGLDLFAVIKYGSAPGRRTSLADFGSRVFQESFDLGDDVEVISRDVMSFADVALEVVKF